MDLEMSEVHSSSDWGAAMVPWLKGSWLGDVRLRVMKGQVRSHASIQCE